MTTQESAFELVEEPAALPESQALAIPEPQDTAPDGSARAEPARAEPARAEAAEAPDDPWALVDLSPAPPLLSWAGLGRRLEALFGLAAAILGLAILATIPVLQLISFGYLLAACGRVARTGRLRDGLLDLHPIARAGSIALGIWGCLLPLRILASLHTSARIIDPQSPAARNLALTLGILTPLLGLHIALALLAGGRIRDFLWPFGPLRAFLRRCREGGLYGQVREELWEGLASLHLTTHLWLGLRGFVGTLMWLLIPTSLLAAGTRAPGLGWLGALTLTWLVMVLPFLQAHFAREGRFGAFFELGVVRERFRHAPFAFLFALAVTLVLPTPLYLLKVELVAAEAGWLPALVFIVFIFPARILTGWAYGRASRRPERVHWLWRLISKPALLPLAAFYVLLVWGSQFISWEGIGSLYGQHAFLLPVPFSDFGDF